MTDITGVLRNINRQTPRFYTFTIMTLDQQLHSFWTEYDKTRQILDECENGTKIQVAYTQPNNHCIDIVKV